MTARPTGMPCWPAPDLPPAPAVRGDVDVDVAVVGAGLAGCAVALRLLDRQPTLRIALVDADRPAVGASGRGTGLVGPRIGPPIDVAVRRFGVDVARANHLASVAGVAAVVELARRFAPDSLQKANGQLIIGRTAGEAKALGRRAETYASLGLDVHRWVEPRAFGGMALRYPDAAGVNPAALVSGLVDELTRRGVTRYDGSPVRRIEGGPTTTCHLDQGRVRAATVVVTADGGARRLGLPVGPLRDVQVCAVATAPLPDDLIDQLGGRNGPQVICAGELAPYWRITGEGALILGGGQAIDPHGLSTARRLRAQFRTWQRLESALPAIHPGLESIGLASRWSGVVTITEDGLPVVGRVDMPGRVWFAGGWCGHGLAASVAASAVVADGVLGAGTADKAAPPWVRSRAPSGPLTSMPAPIFRLALTAVAAHQDRLTTQAARAVRSAGGFPEAKSTPQQARADQSAEALRMETGKP